MGDLVNDDQHEELQKPNMESFERFIGRECATPGVLFAAS